MLTCLPSATGSAAPSAKCALVDQPGRAATCEAHGDGRSPCALRFGKLAAATLAVHPSSPPVRPSEAMALDVGWKRGTLVPTYMQTIPLPGSRVRPHFRVPGKQDKSTFLEISQRC
eukprot:7162957-Prymnesium_polylepis.1